MSIMPQTNTDFRVMRDETVPVHPVQPRCRADACSQVTDIVCHQSRLQVFERQARSAHSMYDRHHRLSARLLSAIPKKQKSKTKVSVKTSAQVAFAITHLLDSFIVQLCSGHHHNISHKVSCSKVKILFLLNTVFLYVCSELLRLTSVWQSTDNFCWVYSPTHHQLLKLHFQQFVELMSNYISTVIQKDYTISIQI